MLQQLEFLYKDKVRYSDCDMHQHLNHAKYFSFFEQARVEYFAALGMKPTSDYRSIPVIIASAHCDYRAPAHLNDDIEVRLGVSHIGTKSFRLDYQMCNAASGELLAEAYTVQVMFDYDKKCSIPISEKIRKKIGELKKTAMITR